LYTTINQIKTSKEGDYFKINIISDNYAQEISGSRSKSYPEREYYYYERSSTLREKMEVEDFGRLLKSDIIKEENQTKTLPNSRYNEEIVFDSRAFGVDCPWPKHDNFGVREDYNLVNSLNLYTEIGIVTTQKYYGWITSSYCHFESEVKESKLFYKNQEIYSYPYYLEVQGGKKNDNQKIIINLGKNDSVYNIGENMLYSFDDGQTWHIINNFYEEINANPWKPEGEKNSIFDHTSQELSQNEVEFYESLLSTESFWGRSFGNWEGHGSNIVYRIKDIQREGKYIVFVLSNGDVGCIKSEIGKNDFFTRYCDRRVYFETESGELDAVKTIESIENFPEEIKDMKNNGWNQELAADYIKKI